MTYYEMMEWADSLYEAARRMPASEKRHFILSWHADLIQDFILREEI